MTNELEMPQRHVRLAPHSNKTLQEEEKLIEKSNKHFGHP